MISGKLKILEKMAIDNSPALLTAVGVVGTLATAVLTHRAATTTTHDILATEAEYKVALSRKEVVKLTWKNYIPPVIVGSLTVTSIVGANRIGSKRAAAVAAAYTLSERTFNEYREKVAEKFGENKARAVQDDIAQDRVRNNPPGENNMVFIGTGDVLCFDQLSGRYLNSSVEDLKKAQNDTNYEILHAGYASVTDFYDRIGLPRTDISDELGWTQDQLVELEFSTVLAEDGRRPCVAFRFHTRPVRNYQRLHP